MFSVSKNDASVRGGDMPAEKRKRAERIIELFEAQLKALVSASRIPARHIRPLLRGSVLCGALDDHVWVGYLPQVGVPYIAFMTMTSNLPVQHGLSAFYNWLMDETGQDFSVVELRESWLDLNDAPRAENLKAVALQVVQNELSRIQVKSTMIPFNPVFGQNTFPIQENMVFVLMPFEDPLTAIYTNVVKPTVESRNLICRRADDLNTNNAIMSDIWKSICEARFIIADLSKRNANVMYELGIAHTVGKETILIHQNMGSDRFPFDLAHFRIIDYQDNAVGGTELKNKLEGTIDNVLQKLIRARIT